MINQANDKAKELGGSLVGVGVGAPGRFVNGVIKPDTCWNLGNQPSEFDNVNLKEKYKEALKQYGLENLPIEVCNDGNAMLSSMLETIKNGKKGIADQHGNEVTQYGLRRETVGLLGIGTGVGNAFVKIEGDLSQEFVTDGHISKFRLPVDEQDWQKLQEAKTFLEAKNDTNSVIFDEDNTASAETLFRGPTVAALAGLDDGKDLDLSNPKHREAVEFAGKYMARTIAAVKNGQSTDVVPSNGWNDADKQQAKETSMYLIGGGFGSSPAAKEMIKIAQKELDKLGVSDIKLVQMTGENFAARSAATLVPETAYKQSREVI